QSLQPPPQIRRLADVRLGLSISGPQDEHHRGRRNRGEDFRISPRREFQPLSEHEFIVSKSSPQKHRVTENLFFYSFAPCLSVSVVRPFLPEAGTPELLPKIRPVEGNDPAHLVQSRAHALPNTVP